MDRMLCFCFVFGMIRRQPRPKRTVTPVPYTGLFRSCKATIGTGSALMAAAAARAQSTHGLSATVAWQHAEAAPQYAIEGNISVSGHAAAFATALLGLADEAELKSLAARVPHSGRPVFARTDVA